MSERPCPPEPPEPIADLGMKVWIEHMGWPVPDPGKWQTDTMCARAMKFPSQQKWSTQGYWVMNRGTKPVSEFGWIERTIIRYFPRGIRGPPPPEEFSIFEGVCLGIWMQRIGEKNTVDIAVKFEVTGETYGLERPWELHTVFQTDDVVELPPKGTFHTRVQYLKPDEARTALCGIKFMTHPPQQRQIGSVWGEH